ncbi:MAG: T9SS type A sorting domain-containing protein [Candidatus Cloacimonetes bacterium]|nr:T9SS type A sorting domain-containing protein [Candidatus Cloacimonadota bacterium]
MFRMIMCSVLITIIFMLCGSIEFVHGSGIKSLNTDKARYELGSVVKLKLEIDEYVENLQVQIQYFHLDRLIGSETLSITSTFLNWEWFPPAEDFKGYLINVVLLVDDEVVDNEVIGVDVSSDWKKFPRYGFLSSFNPINPTVIAETIDKLNRYHINGLQYYDWQYKHHKPLKGTGTDPAITWTDIANRTVYLPTLRNYIDTAHSRNIASMAYNLIYGAYEDAEVDGVSNEWRIFTDANHLNPDFHDLPSDWASDIYLINPDNQLWQNHIIFEMEEAFTALDFDGWHVDQLGNRGTRYDYNGNQIDLPQGFLNLLTEAKNELNCSLVMNAVNQYAQNEIADSPVDFLYTEVWEPNTTFDKLAQIILNNDAQTNGELKTVLAAYIHKGLSSSPGEFNTPAVLYANAVIFSFGGVHLELGEHMLCNEYFPVDNLVVTAELEEQLITYYDFLVAYQNLLRGNGEVVNDQLQTTGELEFVPWARTLKVWNFVREADNKKIFHLINFSDASTLDWRDNLATQTAPAEYNDVPVYYETTDQVYNVWIASPDYENGIPVNLDFTQTDGKVNFTLPSLKYWDMVVVDFDSATSVNTVKRSPNEYILYQNYPNPFNPTTSIKFSVPKVGYVQLKVYDAIGREVAVLVNERQESGTYTVNFNGEKLASGVYFYEIVAGEFRDVRKMLLVK